MNNSRYRQLLIYGAIFLVIAIFIVTVANPTSGDNITVSELVSDINAGEVSEIQRSDGALNITYKDNTEKRAEISPNIEDERTYLENQQANPEQLNAIEFSYEQRNGFGNVLNIFIAILPLIVIAVFIYFMVRQAQGSNNQAMQFGRSRARMFSGDHPTVTFDDVAGSDEAKEELREVVEFLKEPDKFIQLGARIPKGVLLVGSPGTGKTLLAKAVAGEAGVPFFSISGSEFVEMFVGVGASRVRDLFEQAKRHSPCIIFVDEIDAVGRHRGSGLGGSHDEREQTLNQILVEMDGFDTDTNVIVVAATNRPDILDPALLRPGRFDRRVILDRPDAKGREAIFRVHTRGKPLAPDVDIKVLAKSTPGLVGADIENLVNEAAIVAARKNRKSIGMRDFEEATERVFMGPERKSRVISPEERRTIAYHEAGHAVVMHMVEKSYLVRKITIVARGMAGGVTWRMPADDSSLGTVETFRDMIAGTLGGRAAEQIALGKITNGAASDLEHVTNLARQMITRWGMSEKLGPRVFGRKEEMIFLGRDIAEERDYSDSVAELIDEEVQRLINEEYQRALQVLSENRDKLEAVTVKLLEVETLSRDEFLIIMGEEPEGDDESRPMSFLDEMGETPSPLSGNEYPPKLGPAPTPA